MACRASSDGSARSGWSRNVSSVWWKLRFLILELKLHYRGIRLARKQKDLTDLLHLGFKTGEMVALGDAEAPVSVLVLWHAVRWSSSKVSFLQNVEGDLRRGYEDNDGSATTTLGPGRGAAGRCGVGARSLRSGSGTRWRRGPGRGGDGVARYRTTNRRQDLPGGTGGGSFQVAARVVSDADSSAVVSDADSSARVKIDSAVSFSRREGILFFFGSR
ncbi:hypothetical protein EJB05_27063, partial [Eragrostis curvula]